MNHQTAFYRVVSLGPSTNKSIEYKHHATRPLWIAVSYTNNFISGLITINLSRTRRLIMTSGSWPTTVECLKRLIHNLLFLFLKVVYLNQNYNCILCFKPTQHCEVNTYLFIYPLVYTLFISDNAHMQFK